MKETMIIAMNELMNNNYRHFKEEVKKNFFWDDMKDVVFEVETGYDRYKDWGGQTFKSFYSAYKYVQRIFAEATNVTAEKYETYDEYGDDYYKYKAEDYDGYEDERDEIYCQINMFYDDDDDREYAENLCWFEKMDENKILFKNWL
jgi:hypothetical protein